MKCQGCGEWIKNGVDECPQCGRSQTTKLFKAGHDDRCEWVTGGKRCAAIGDISPDVPSGNQKAGWHPRWFCLPHFWCVLKSDWRSGVQVLDDYDMNGTPVLPKNWIEQHHAKLVADETSGTKSKALTEQDKKDWIDLWRTMLKRVEISKESGDEPPA